MKKLSSPLLTCSFTVCGLNLERFLALMQQEEIPLEDVRRTGRRTLRCQCRTADFAAVTQIAADKGWRIREVRPERASAVWSSWKARPGLWVGMVLALLMGRLTRMARLPEIVGLAMPTALCSNAAANSILVSSHAEGQIRTSALIAGGMMNSYLAYISHSIRVMFPVIGAIGLPGVLYFGMQFTGGFLVLLCILLWNRWYVSRHGESPCATEPGSTSQPLAWPHAISKAAIRSFSLLFRMACMTVPLMLGIEWLLKNGVLDFWETALPHAVTELFPTELLSAVAAQFGGLVQSSAVAANLRAEGLIDNSQILLAMLVGSALGNPFRALRRNLPSALAIFPVPIALSIVLGMQLSRFLVTLAGIAGVVWMMLNTP